MRLLGILAGMGVSSVASAATLQVGSTRTYTDIQSAVDAASSGDIIEVDPDTYTEWITIQGIDLTVVSTDGSGSTTIRAPGGDGTVVTIAEGTVTFEGFRVTDSERGLEIDDATVDLVDVRVDGHGWDENGVGGWIHGGSTVTITDAAFEENEAEESAGAHLYISDGSSVDISDTTFEAGDAFWGGAIATSGSSVLVLSDTTFDDNRGRVEGGALYLGSGATVSATSSTFTANQGDDDGGAVFAASSTTTTLALTDTLFTGNLTDGDGAAMFLEGTAVTSTRTTVSGHDTTGDGTVTLELAASWDGTDDLFTSNVTTGAGGAVFAGDSASLVLTGASFDANAAAIGGGLAIEGTGDLTLDGVSITHSTASTAGAGLAWSSTGSLSITDGWFADNVAASGYAGGLAATAGTVDLAGTYFADNAATYGGGAVVTGVADLSLTNNLWCANDASTGSGGGLYVSGAGATAFAVENNIFAENTAAGNGGGAYIASSSAPGIVNNDFLTNDAAGDGGGVYFADTPFDFTNNIVAWTVGGDGVSSDTATGALSFTLTYNDWYGNTAADLGGGLGSVTLDSSNLADDPLLADYTADGDCTNDWFFLDSSSTLIDAGDPSITDPDGTDSDIGAYGGTGADEDAFTDADGDGYSALVDCDDDDATVNPGADEVCDEVDNDCDGAIDEPDAIDAVTWFEDADDDGYGDAGSTTDACTQPSGYVDNDEDCDDTDEDVNPAADEVCDGVDNDCDGTVDVGAVDETTWFLDDDADGFGDPLVATDACDQPTGYVDNDEDCDDGDADIHPDADEVCDGVDNDCDAVVDEASAVDASTWYRDADTDGYGDPDADARACDQPSGYVADDTDCDDTEYTTNPAADEYCDGVDNDCDGVVDNDAVDAVAWYADTDGDGWGDDASVVYACEMPSGYAEYGGDCDDTDTAFYPGAPEDCDDPTDYNCDGSVGDADLDLDGVQACDDCDDTDATVYPGADEVCDDVDNNCDGVVDEATAVDAGIWYLDADGDGYGDIDGSVVSCDQPPGYVANPDDCDDADDAVYPGAPEECGTGIDSNCDGSVGDADLDGDGVQACDDCDDTDALRFPGADEVCDEVDNDCDGEVDEDGAIFGDTYYGDLDGDGYGNPDVSVRSCDPIPGYVTDDTDCDDDDFAVNPGAEEIWYDGVDGDCDGWSDYDQDHDGYDHDGYLDGTDCDDLDPGVNPGAVDVADDGVDQDCDGADTEGRPDTGDEDPKTGGCNCTVGSTAPASGLSLFLFVLGMGLVRRRVRL